MSMFRWPYGMNHSTRVFSIGSPTDRTRLIAVLSMDRAQQAEVELLRTFLVFSFCFPYDRFFYTGYVRVLSRIGDNFLIQAEKGPFLERLLSEGMKTVFYW